MFDAQQHLKNKYLKIAILYFIYLIRICLFEID